MIIISEYTDKNKKTLTDNSYLDNLDAFKQGEIYNDISIEAEEDSPKKKLEKLTKERIKLRKAVSSGKIDVGDKDVASKNNRISAINDLFRGLFINWTNEDGSPKFNQDELTDPSYSGYITDPELYEGIKNLLSNEPDSYEKLAALENYVNNGGYANQVFDYLTSVGNNVTNPYGVDTKGIQENLQKGTLRWEEPTNKTENVVNEVSKIITTYVTYPFRMVLGLQNLGLKGLNKLGAIDSMMDATYNQWDKGTTEEYNQYKKGKQLENDRNAILGIDSTSREGLYKEYDLAKQQGFNGTVEQYAQYKKELDRYVKDVVIDEGFHLMDEEMIESDKALILADWMGEVMSFFGMEQIFGAIGGAAGESANIASKINKTKNLMKGGWWKNLGNWFKVNGKELLTGLRNYVNRVAKDVIETEVSEAGRKSELPESDTVLKDTLINMGLELIVSSPRAYKFFKESAEDLSRALSPTPKVVNEALGTQTTAQWGGKLSTVENQGLHPETTAELELGKDWQSAASEVKKAKIKAGEDVSAAVMGAKGTAKPSDVIKSGENSLNKAMQRLSTEAGELSIAPDKVPVFDIAPDGKMTIYNKDVLNAYKNKDGEALGDVIETLYNNKFEGGRMKENAASAYSFMKEVENAIYESDLSGSPLSNKLKTILVEWKDAAKNQILDSMDTTSREIIKEAEKKFKNVSDLDEVLDIYITKTGVKDKGLLSELQKTEIGKKVQNGGDIIRIIAEKLQAGNYTKKDLAAETVAWAYAIAIKDPQLAVDLIETMYPSIPGLREFFLKEFRRNVAEKTSYQLLKDSTNILDRAQATAKSAWSDIKSSVAGAIPPSITAGINRISGKNQDKYGDEDIWEAIDLYSY